MGLFSKKQVGASSSTDQNMSNICVKQLPPSSVDLLNTNVYLIKKTVDSGEFCLCPVSALSISEAKKSLSDVDVAFVTITDASGVVKIVAEPAADSVEEEPAKKQVKKASQVPISSVHNVIADGEEGIVYTEEDFVEDEGAETPEELEEIIKNQPAPVANTSFLNSYSVKDFDVNEGACDTKSYKGPAYLKYKE